MKFYNVKDDYINFLRKYDSKVSKNKHEQRPYVGVVIEVNNIKYYAPFTSPKPKHKKMKNSKDFRKIKNGDYGAINFNNMIPVTDEAIILIDIEAISDEKYKRLLQNQYKSILSDKDGITRTAKNLYALLQKDDDVLSPYDRAIKNRCCNIEILEKIINQYNTQES